MEQAQQHAAPSGASATTAAFGQTSAPAQAPVTGSDAMSTRASRLFIPVTRLVSPRDQTMQRYLPTGHDANATSSQSVHGANASPSLRLGYLNRRLAMLRGTNHTDNISASAICSLPLECQLAFRRKMFGVFALQLLFVLVLVLVLQQINGLSEKIVQLERHFAFLGGALGASLVLLALLYLVRDKFPLNWIILVLFSMTISVFYVAIGSRIATNALVLLNCGFPCFVVLLMTQTTMWRTRSGNALALPKAPTAPTAPRPEQGQQQQQTSSKDLRAYQSFLVAFAVVTVLAIALECLLGNTKWLSAKSFWYSLCFQMVLLAWFVFDASKMVQVLTPDEYMRGVIYFYIDLVLLVVILLVILGLSMLLVACAAGVDQGGAAMCECTPTCSWVDDSGCDLCCNCRRRRRSNHQRVYAANEPGPRPQTDPTTIA